MNNKIQFILTAIAFMWLMSSCGDKNTSNLKLNESGQFVQMYHDNGSIHRQGKVIDSIQQGITLAYYNNGIPKELNDLRDGKPYGMHIEYFESGLIKRFGIMVGTLASGPWVSYFENGIVKDVTDYKDGSYNGNKVVYHENGVKAVEAHYVNNKANGRWFYYDKQHNITKMEIYKMDSLIRTEFPKD